MLTLKQEIEREVQKHRTKLLRDATQQAKQLDRIIKRILTSKYHAGPIPLHALVSMTMMKWGKTTIDNYVKMRQQVEKHIHRSKILRITAGFNGGVRLR